MSFRGIVLLMMGALLTGLLAAALLSGRVDAAAADDLLGALAPPAGTPDAAATVAVATFAAALRAPLPPAVALAQTPTAAAAITLSPAAAATPGATASATPALTPTPKAALTPTLTPSRTPDSTATAAALQGQIDRAVAATLTAQPTSTPPPATPTPAAPLAAQGAAAAAAIGIVAEEGPINLRSGPGTDYPILREVPSGEQVLILGRSQDAAWLNVRTAAGTLGWMSALYVRTTQSPAGYPVVAGGGRTP